MGVVAVNAIERSAAAKAMAGRCERAGFHDDAVEGIIGTGIDKAFGWGGVVDGMTNAMADGRGGRDAHPTRRDGRDGVDRTNGRDARSSRTDGRRDAYPTIFWFPRHRLIRSIGSGIGSRSIGGEGARKRRQAGRLPHSERRS